MVRWKIELLGGLRLLRPDLPEAPAIVRFRTQKTAALLGCLAYHVGREYGREELTEILWPEDDRDTGRHKLNVALSSLRTQLEPAGVPPGSVLATGRLTVRLDPDLVTTDAGAFEAALRAAEAQGDSPEGLACLTRAVELYQGRLLPACYEEWVLPEQQRLEERYLRAVRRLAALLTAGGRPEEAMQHVLAAVSIDPLREETHREVIRLYLALGHPAAARKQYVALEKLLADALGTTPSPATRALLESPVPRPPAGATPLEAGVGRASLETIGGAVPLDSKFYVRRETDARFEAAVARRDSIVLLKGVAQAGKTSLLARGLRRARAGGARVVRTDFQLLNAARFESAETLLRTLAELIAEQLDPAPPLPAGWEGLGGPNMTFRRFLRQGVLGCSEVPVVWGMDGVDRLFSVPFGSELFELFRSLHNERAFDPDGPWTRLTLAIAYATEAHLFIQDPNRSPFNVGTRLELEDFTPEQVADLNARYGRPLRDAEEQARFYRLLNGHPYLVRRGLYELAVGGVGVAALEAQAHRDEWIFGDHLRRLRALLRPGGELEAAVREVLCGGPCPADERFYRLRSAGILAGESDQPRLRCELYRIYLGRQLLGA